MLVKVRPIKLRIGAFNVALVKWRKRTKKPNNFYRLFALSLAVVVVGS